MNTSQALKLFGDSVVHLIITWFLKNKGDKLRKINWVKIMGLRWQAKVLELDFVRKLQKILILTLSEEVTISELHIGEMGLSVVQTGQRNFIC